MRRKVSFASRSSGTESHLSVGFSSSKIDGNGDDEADSNPDCWIEIGPITDKYGGSVELSGQHDRPVVPTAAASQ